MRPVRFQNQPGRPGSFCARACGVMALHAAWVRAPEGRLAPTEQAKLWGLRWALRKLKQDDKQYGWMAAQVKVNGTGDKLGKDNPSGDVVRKFFQRVDEMGKSWHPGKKSQSVGRPKDMTEAKAGTLECTATLGVLGSRAFQMAKGFAQVLVYKDGFAC